MSSLTIVLIHTWCVHSVLFFLQIISVHPFLVFICLLCLSESLKSPVTSSVVTINVFLRADEIEMVMTDLERANQVTWHTNCTFIHSIVHTTRLYLFYCKNAEKAIWSLTKILTIKCVDLLLLKHLIEWYSVLYCKYCLGMQMLIWLFVPLSPLSFKNY